MRRKLSMKLVEMASKDYSNSRFDTLVLGSENVEIDQTDSLISCDGSKGAYSTDAQIGLLGVVDASIDQSGSKIAIKGNSKATVLNRVDGGRDIHVKQNNTTTYVEGGAGSDITAVNYITDTQNYTQTISDSNIVVKSKGRGVTAHTVVGGGAEVSIITINSSSISISN